MIRQTPISSLLLFCVLTGTAWADESKQPKGKSEGSQDVAARFQPSDEVLKTLTPLFSSISEAEVSRVTVQLSAESLVNGAVVDSQKSTYQIASRQPDRFTIYLKEPDQRTRIYCDGKAVAVAMAPDAFFRLPDVIDLQQAATNCPVPLGPYPEAVLALSLAGADPTATFLSGMRSVQVVDRGKFRGKIPAIHIRGVQDDDVAWDLWITQGKTPKPLRLLVDLTAMLRATNQVQITEGFRYLLRFDFLGWRVTGEVDDKLFEYAPPSGAKEYKSLDDYYEAIAGAVAEHPLLGKQAPVFKAKTLSGQTVTAEQLQNKVIVIDFWATWCVPCSSVIPILKKVTDEYAEKGVVFLAVNVGEAPAKIKGFVEEQDWDLVIALDQDTKISGAFAAEAIPLTLVIGKTGVVESAHVGFPGAEALRKRLVDELDVLSIGGRIASAEAEED